MSLSLIPYVRPISKTGPLPKYFISVTFSPSHNGLPGLSHHQHLFPRHRHHLLLGPLLLVLHMRSLSFKPQTRDLLQNTSLITSPLLKTLQCLPIALS